MGQRDRRPGPDERCEDSCRAGEDKVSPSPRVPRWHRSADSRSLRGDDRAVIGKENGAVLSGQAADRIAQPPDRPAGNRARGRFARRASRNRPSSAEGRLRDPRPGSIETATEWVECRCTTAPASCGSQKRRVQRKFLRGRISRDKPASGVETAQAGGVEETERGIRRGRKKAAIGEANRDVAGRPAVSPRSKRERPKLQMSSRSRASSLTSAAFDV